ncbi:5-formyltetrahydrofolate cyclo-ligase [Sphingomonas spermidinifaciens]|uniref:5-formyltetrahydrofolate cyclo-ligase n=1 Tax=Sphingomonas spermidinifaciens TaxID=1141889 RepID=UPI001FE3E848|nr:5-formyltetrahydrofolate cyclo-ligase [Sphingomonas spermidinifaciens]
MRARLRALRDAFVAGGPSPIRPPAALLDRLRPDLIVASYLPLGSEADPEMLAQAALAAGCTLALPRTTTRAAQIAFHRFAAGDPIETGPFGLRQPAPDAPIVKPDIVLVPLVAFDGACNRLGQGAGHYDRALAALPGAWPLGVAWSVQQVPLLPVDPWDRPLAGIVTELDFIERTDPQ